VNYSLIGFSAWSQIQNAVMISFGTPQAEGDLESPAHFAGEGLTV
jgi:hypothetical protein